MNVSIADDESRVRDYLDDRLQTAADLESLDSLLENVRNQQNLLQAQAQEAKAEHMRAEKLLDEHSADLQSKTSAFEQQQKDIDRTLLIVTRSDSTEEAVARFRNVMGNLHRLEIATGYVELATEAEALRASVATQLHGNIDRAIDSYVRLRSLADDLLALQLAAEGAAPHLIDHVGKSAAFARNSIFNAIADDMSIILKRIGWPKTHPSIPSSSQREWTDNIDRLLALQRPELLKAMADNTSRLSKAEPLVLAPLEILVKSLAMRFQYHFSGDRMTNRIDKPEYFFNHVFDLINDHAEFINDSMQTLVLQRYGKSDLALVPAYTDTTTAWITALLPLLRTKLQSVLPEVGKQSSLFSNLIHEVMAFDAQLQDEWDYAPLSPSTPFRGLSHFVLSDLAYFPAWFAIERDFALSRYDAIISDRSTGELDYESVDAHVTKPTKAAVRVNDLLETITDRYRLLAPFHQKMKFLIDIQISIFDRFHARLHGGLEAYLTRTSTVARTVHGVSQGDDGDISGTKGLDRLCRIYGSSEYLERAMQDWSEDVFFLDLWEELQSRSQQRDQVKGDLSIQDMSAKTSSAVIGEADEMQGALFDETAAAYKGLRTRSEQVIVDTVIYDVRTSLRAYTKVNTWASMAGTGGKPTLTAELDAAVRVLDDYFGFLGKAVGKTALRRIAGPVMQTLQNQIWEYVLLRHTFSTAGATQLRSDIDGLSRVVRRHTEARLGASSMSKLFEALRLLSLPVRGETQDESTPQTPMSALDQPTVGLWEVERRLFANNESAREVLEDLGIESLTETDARDVLKRRIEVSS